MSLVNRKEQEQIIIEIENTFKKFELMPDEKMFIMNEVIGRIRQGQEKQKFSDLVGGGIGGGLIKSIQKKFMKEDEE